MTGAGGRLPERDLAELLKLSPSPWRHLAGQRILVTGATGLIGRWVLASFLAAVDAFGIDASAVALIRDSATAKERFPEIFLHPKVETEEDDVRSYSVIGPPPTYVIHLAAPSPAVQREDPLKAFDIVVQGAKCALEVAAEAEVKGFLLASSGSVYGRGATSGVPVPEHSLSGPDPLDSANSAYDEGKRAAEALGGLYAHQFGLPVAIARIFSVIGPGMPLSGHHAAGNFIRDAVAGGPIAIEGDGSPVRSYIYLADLAWWLWTALIYGQSGRAYNMGGAEAVTILELADLIASSVSPPPPVIVAKPKGNAPPSRYVPDISRAELELGLRVRVDLPEAVRRTLAWARGA